MFKIPQLILIISLMGVTIPNQTDMVVECPDEIRSLYIGNYFHFPSRVFDSVEINRELVDETPDKRIKKCGDIDFLLKNAAVFALGTREGDTRLLQTPTLHRGAILIQL